MGGRHISRASAALVEQQHRPALLDYALRMTRGDQAAAHHVVEEAFDRAARHPAGLSQNPRPWLVLTARTVFAESAAAPPKTRRARKATNPVASTTVVRAMGTLSHVHREILVELVYRGTSLEDAAAARDLSVETVKSRLYYAMRALREQTDGPPTR